MVETEDNLETPSVENQSSPMDHSSDNPGPAPDEPGFVLALRKINDVFGVVEMIIIALFTILLIWTSLVAWQDEGQIPPLLKYSLFCLAMAMAVLATQADRMISLDFILRKFAPSTGAKIKLLNRLFTLIILYYLYKMGMDANPPSEGHEPHFMTQAHAKLALPIAAALMAFHTLIFFVIECYYVINGKVPPASNEPAVH